MSKFVNIFKEDFIDYFQDDVDIDSIYPTLKDLPGDAELLMHLDFDEATRDLPIKCVDWCLWNYEPREWRTKEYHMGSYFQQFIDRLLE